MTRRCRFTLVALFIACLLTLAASVGMTAAIWAGEGSTNIAPAVNVSDWNVWSKYFRYEAVEGGIALVGFDETGNLTGTANAAGGNTTLGDVIIPVMIENKTVVEIRNSVFASVTAKNSVLTLVIPCTVSKIAENAFSGLSALKSVTFAAPPSNFTPVVCNVSMFAFSGCQALESLTIEQNMKVEFADFCFAGCGALSKVNAYEGYVFSNESFLGSAYTPVIVP